MLKSAYSVSDKWPDRHRTSEIHSFAFKLFEIATPTSRCTLIYCFKRVEKIVNKICLAVNQLKSERFFLCQTVSVVFAMFHFIN